MALESRKEHPQKQGSLATGNSIGDLVGGGFAAGINITSRFAGGGSGSFALFPIRVLPVPRELFNSPFAGKPVDIDHRCKAPYGWQRCLNLKNGKIFFKDLLTEDHEENCGDGDMSRSGKTPKLDLRLNLSTHRGGSSSEVAGGSAIRNNNNNNNNSNRSSSSNSSPSLSSSPPSSCLSSETEQGRLSGSPEATSMVLVGCPRCLMYVMLSEDDPKCPKCKSTVLLDFLKDPKNAAATCTKKTRKN